MVFVIECVAHLVVANMLLVVLVWPFLIRDLGHFILFFVVGRDMVLTFGRLVNNGVV